MARSFLVANRGRGSVKQCQQYLTVLARVVKCGGPLTTWNSYLPVGRDRHLCRTHGRARRPGPSAAQGHTTASIALKIFNSPSIARSAD